LQTSLDRAADDVVRHAFVGDTYVARIDLHSWDDEVPKCELGYVANAAILGHGLVTEACQTMIDIAWSMGVVRVQAVCDSRNERAIRMAERLGMRREGVLRHNDRDEAGSLVDEVILAITRG
ncbi:MAG TPA: GNAT family protein, partial [Ilumatobacteraceae bacterium]|nr:GNAT family protein [Ilumatobacteraceae bacterium]